MVLDAVSNFVRGRVSAPVATSDTTVSVEDASIFPDPSTDGEYNVAIWDANNFPRPDQDSDVEIVRVTGRDTGADELTVVRGQETTSDVAHPSGSAVHLSPTAKMFSDIEAEYTAQGENFDGQGTSEFSNLRSVNAEKANSVLYVTPAEHNSGDRTIQDAIDNLPSGGTVELERGQYDVTENINLRSNMTLRGQGYDSLLRHPTGDSDETVFMLFAEEEEDIVIRDLRVENAPEPDTGSASECIDTKFCRRVFIINCWVGESNGSAADGIDFDDDEFCFAINCVTYDNDGGGIHISSGSKYCGAINCLSYRDRQVSDTADGELAAIDTNGADHSYIKDCYAIDSRNHAFAKRGGGLCRFENNYAINPDATGLTIWADEYRVDGLYVEDADGYGVHVVEGANDGTLRDVTIDGVSGSSARGIATRATSAIENPRVENVNPDAEFAGIWVREHDGTVIRDATVRNCHNAIEFSLVDYGRVENIVETEGISNDILRRANRNRIMVDGWGINEGDPSVEGDWNGNGFEGAAVVDILNNDRYVYRDGAWV